MARRNSRFVNQKVIIGNKSIQEGDLTDSARDALGADSDFVKTVQNFPGSNITASSISPSAIADQDQLIASTGALTTGGILTISRDGGNSFINFDSVDQFEGGDSSLTVEATPTGFDFLTKYATGPIPFTTSSRITVNLQTPIQNQQDLLHFFNVDAGAETDEIHSVQILDSATENDYEYALEDENGVLHYLNLLDSIPYGDPRLSTAGGDNEIDIIGGQRLWQGIKGARLADSALEFGDSDAGTGIQTRNIGSRLRFRTRKSVPSSEAGGAPSSYKLDAPEGPIGVGVSSPVYSKVSPRFVYRVVKGTQAQGFVAGYASSGQPLTTSVQRFPFATDTPATNNFANFPYYKAAASGQSSATHGYSSGGYPQSEIYKFSFASGGPTTLVGNLTTTPRTGTAGQSSTTHGYASGGEHPRYTIDEFPFATDTNATGVGNITGFQRGWAAGESSTTHGYTSGGGGGGANEIDKFPFASGGPATDVGDLGVGRVGVAGQSSDVSGYASGGDYPGPLIYRIDKFPFATDTNATFVGDLIPYAREYVSGQSSTVSGYTSGGNPGRNMIDKFPFATDTNATSVGTLAAGKHETSGQQN